MARQDGYTNKNIVWTFIHPLWSGYTERKECVRRPNYQVAGQAVFYIFAVKLCCLEPKNLDC